MRWLKWVQVTVWSGSSRLKSALAGFQSPDDRVELPVRLLAGDWTFFERAKVVKRRLQEMRVFSLKNLFKETDSGCFRALDGRYGALHVAALGGRVFGR